MPINKNGPMAMIDKEYIKNNYRFLTPKELAANLQRNPKTIVKFLKQNDLLETARRVSAIANIEYDIRKSPHWPILKKQFTPDELETFMYHWNNTIKQFRDDVTHLEELQIVDMIKMELLMNRLLIDERTVAVRLKELEEEIMFERARDMPDLDLIRLKSDTFAVMQASKVAVGKEYREMDRSKQKMFENLKATRDQRLEEVENSKDTMVGWVKQLMQSPELRKRLGITAEKMRLAHTIEFKRLSEYHKYYDGEIDQPILTSETVKEDHN